MNRPSPWTACQLNRLHDQAHADALALRDEAIDDFWRGANAWVGSAASRVDRSARRWAHAWRRRGQRGGCTTPCA